MAPKGGYKVRSTKNECWFCTHKRSVPGSEQLECVKPDPDMTGNQHGIENGWFIYPTLFDPTWKTRACGNFQEVEESEPSFHGADPT